MKGLLLKDFYMMKQYCKMYLVVTAIFIAVSFVAENNMFFVFYPSLLCGMIPVTLIGYDERSKWMQYSATLPYTKAQIVSAKYIIGLMVQVVVMVVVGVAQAVQMVMADQFAWGSFGVMMLLLLIVSTMTYSISLPFIFKSGVEKGRIAYYVMIGVVSGASAISSSFYRKYLTAEIKPGLLLTILAAAGIGLYILSWYLSILFFKKREI